ncbi:MAG: hypothetical protein JWM27_1609 [Gemmatimonadetes bacterium]|nr:hypothetical protein [Gemmatimonadota bacterium]
MAAASKGIAREQARALINKWAIGFASVAWIPGSHLVMSVGDLTMVMQVGSIYGVELDKTKAGALFATVAAPLIGSKIAHTILDFVPIVGWGAKSVVAAGVTKSVGAALMRYFDDCSPLPEIA